MARIGFDKALVDWRRVAATSDRAWETYRKARERVAKERAKKGRASFAAEQAVILAGEAVERSKWPTEEKLANLRVACSHKANNDVWLEVRARLAKAPEYGEINERSEILLKGVLHNYV